MQAGKCLVANFLLLVILFSLIFSASLFSGVGAVTYLPAGTPLNIPYYGTNIYFSQDQAFSNAPYREDSANTTYGNFWFITLDNGDCFGLLPVNNSITVSSLSYTGSISYSKSGVGSEKIYVASDPVYVEIDGAIRPSGYEWSQSGRIITITGATSEVTLIMADTSDTQAPYYSTLTYSTSLAGNSTTFSGYFSDNTELYTSIFSCDLTGAWANDSINYFTTNPSFATSTKTLPAAVGVTYQWRWYVSDSFGNWLVTPIQTLTTTEINIPPGPTPTPAPSVTPSPSPTPVPTPEASPEPIDYYFRDITHTVNDVIGYELTTTEGDTVASVSASFDGNSTVDIGFMAWLVHNDSSADEPLIGNSPAAILSCGTDGAGMQFTTLTASSKTLVLNLNAIKVTMYMRYDGGEWLSKATFVTDRLLAKSIVGGYWTFYLYTNSSYSLADNETTVTAYWGSSDYPSGIGGIVFTDPLPQEAALSTGLGGDWIGMILYPYVYIIGEIFYGLIILNVGGILWFRHQKITALLVIFLLFGGASGVGLLIPVEAYRTVYVIVLLIIAAVLYKTFR